MALLNMPQQYVLARQEQQHKKLLAQIAVTPLVAEIAVEGRVLLQAPVWLLRCLRVCLAMAQYLAMLWVAVMVYVVIMAAELLFE
jgi:hypothetical protein